ncbi:hypothetical protein BRADI_3g12843v3 [Brachypodium distachyon]|uniref:Uncharacterized protein n=1 Tax=Brachypodium distachyon TaxID=15368 RepID=A0A0Q3LQ86_BRADI|nr:hypothetical protein BRADI_3g12843v3 [Brachypodium distachyon]
MPLERVWANPCVALPIIPITHFTHTHWTSGQYWANRKIISQTQADGSPESKSSNHPRKKNPITIPGFVEAMHHKHKYLQLYSQSIARVAPD